MIKKVQFFLKNNLYNFLIEDGHNKTENAERKDKSGSFSDYVKKIIIYIVILGSLYKYLSK